MIEQVQAEKLRGQIDVADNANRPSAFPQLVIGEGVQKSSFRAVIGIVPAVGSLSGFDLAFPDLHAQRACYPQRQRVVSLADREPTRAVLPDHIGTALRVVYQHNAVAVRVERAADKAGYAPDLEKVRRVTGFVRRAFDPDGDGIVLVNNPQSSADVVWQDRPSRFAVSQGYYALALRVARALGVEVGESEIESAEAAYRGYYADYGAEGAFLHAFLSLIHISE